jgi:hypothetical protein
MCIGAEHSIMCALDKQWNPMIYKLELMCLIRVLCSSSLPVSFQAIQEEKERA